MKPDGSDPVQITHLEGWEPGGAFIFRDNKTIIFRAWRTADASPKNTPAHDALYDSGRRTRLTPLTHDEGTNWSPFPAPDGHHYVS